MQVNNYLNNIEKGEVYQGRVIMVEAVPKIYQDKKCYAAILRDPKNPQGHEKILEGDMLATEVTTGPSLLNEKIGQVVSFVVISPGDGVKQPWIKLDQQLSTTDARDKTFIARDAFRIAADLIISGKVDTPFAKIDELAKRIADKIINLSKQL